jgi:uncharacterized membrane-anchored protein YitT (DUF2179 family)
MKKQNEILINLISFIGITTGALLAAFSIQTFLSPNMILDGGVIGISMIVSKLTNISLSIFTIILNIPFLLIGYKNLGKKFLIKAVYAMLIFSCFLTMFSNVNELTDDILLATIYGGIILGIGVGLVIRSGGCLDGTESVAIIINKKTSLSTGQIIMLFNIFIYLTAGVLFGLDKALYSLLMYFITFKIIDLVSEGLEQAKAAMIITEQGSQIAKEIYNKLGRTATLIEGNGLVSGKKDILYCVLTRMEIPQLRAIVNSKDETAFVTITEVSEIIGEHIKSNKKIKQVRKNIKEIKNDKEIK